MEEYNVDEEYYSDDECTPWFHSDTLSEFEREIIQEVDPERIKGHLLKLGIITAEIFQSLEECSRQTAAELILLEVGMYVNVNDAKGFNRFLYALRLAGYEELATKLEKNEIEQEKHFVRGRLSDRIVKQAKQVIDCEKELADKMMHIESNLPEDKNYQKLKTDVDFLKNTLVRLQIQQKELTDRYNALNSNSKSEGKKSIQDLLKFPAYPKYPSIHFQEVVDKDVLVATVDDWLNERVTCSCHVDNWYETMTNWFSDSSFQSKADLTLVVDKYVEFLETCIQAGIGWADWHQSWLDYYTSIHDLGCGDDVIKMLTSMTSHKILESRQQLTEAINHLKEFTIPYEIKREMKILITFKNFLDNILNNGVVEYEGIEPLKTVSSTIDCKSILQTVERHWKVLDQKNVK